MGACDPYPPSSGAAREAFSVCFPPGKETDVIRFGLKAIVNVRGEREREEEREGGREGREGERGRKREGEGGREGEREREGKERERETIFILNFLSLSLSIAVTLS